jgi:hypothetical protein
MPWWALPVGVVLLVFGQWLASAHPLPGSCVSLAGVLLGTWLMGTWTAVAGATAPFPEGASEDDR